MKEDSSPNIRTNYNILQQTIFNQNDPNNDLKGESYSHGAGSKVPFDKFQFLCIGKNLGSQFCTDEKCQNHSVICTKQECKCKQNHDDCEDFKSIKVVKKNIQSKQNNQLCSKELKNKIDTIVFAMQNLISQMQSRLQEELTLLGMSQTEKEFLRRAQNDKELIKKDEYGALSITTKAVRKYLKAVKKSQEDCIQETTQNMIQVIKQTQKQCFNQFQLLQQQINVKLHFKIQSLSQLQKSNILKQKSDFYRMSTMLKELKPIDSKLIFKGTMKKSSLLSFYLDCEKKCNLLYLVENEFGFKYGGYSPCPISIDKIDDWQTDESLSSFIFSLNINKKAKVTKKQTAIRNVHISQKLQTLVSFGVAKPCSLMISANSFLKQQNNWIRFHSLNSGSSYQQSMDPPSKVVCNGTQSSKCKLKYLQVYQLILPQ